EGEEDLIDRFADVRRRVVANVRIHSPGEVFFQFPHLLAYRLADLQRVGAGELIDAEAHGVLAVELAPLVVVLRVQFDAGHLAQPDDATGGPPPSLAPPGGGGDGAPPGGGRFPAGPLV